MAISYSSPFHPSTSHLSIIHSPATATANSNMFPEYIGVELTNMKLSDSRMYPLTPHSSFYHQHKQPQAHSPIHYTNSPSTSPANGKFNFWDSDNLSHSQVSSIKDNTPKRQLVKVALCLGCDQCWGWFFFNRLTGSKCRFFTSKESKINNEYHLDGINIDYGHFMSYFETQSSKYKGGKVLARFSTDGSGGLSLKDGFFTACSKLRCQGDLHSIFFWSADDSKKMVSVMRNYHKHCW